MANNLVSKNDFNRGGAHKDHKNDYDRQGAKLEVKEMMDEYDGFIEQEETDLSGLWSTFVDNACQIATKEYERSR